MYAGVSVVPASASVRRAESLAFSATGGSGGGYTRVLAANASGGSIEPATGACTAGLIGGVADVVRATDALGNEALRTVTIRADVSVDAAPTAVPPRGSRTFTVSGGGAGYTWSLASNASGGSVDPASGAHRAGPTGSVTDVVRVVDGYGDAAQAEVHVGPGVTVSPPNATATVNTAQAFSASGGSGTGYTWTLAMNASSGAIGGPTGVYTAGPASGVSDVVRSPTRWGTSRRRPWPSRRRRSRAAAARAGPASSGGSASWPRCSCGASYAEGRGRAAPWAKGTRPCAARRGEAHRRRGCVRVRLSKRGPWPGYRSRAAGGRAPTTSPPSSSAPGDPGCPPRDGRRAAPRPAGRQPRRRS